MKGPLILAIISIMFTPLWVGVLILRPDDVYIAIATFTEVCAIGMFSLGASEVIDRLVHPEMH